MSQMSQLNLRFTDPPNPEVPLLGRLWEQFEATHRQIVIELLARLLLQAARSSAEEETDD